LKNGIDVSTYNGKVNWSAVKASGVGFAILRAGYGSDQANQDDSQFARNVSECDRLGLLWGAYLYSYALTVDSAKSELAHLLRLLKGKKPLYPVFIDMEDADGYKASHGMPSNRTLTDIIKVVCSGLQRAGYLPGYYINKDWYENKIDTGELGGYAFWYARPGVAVPDKVCGIWQNAFPETGGHCSGANIDGGGCDTDICYTDYPAQVRARGLNGWAKGSAVPVAAKAAQAAAASAGNANTSTAQQWYNARSAGLKVDGFWGPETRKAAIMSVQRGCNQSYGAGLSVDGIWGPKTDAAIKTLRLGSKNAAVYSLQAVLMAHGYGCGGLDGVFGVSTDSAVRAYQRTAGLSIDGMAGKATFAALCR
jgi:peptidoglycan hydrolase-like protein with peptidoglycan-binding domain